MANTSGSPDPRSAGANNAWPVFRSLDSYRPRFLTHDLVAGLTLAAIAIPEQMATARLGGFSPEIGFFAFLGGSLAFAFFGNNRFLSCGADSTITPIFAGGLTILAASGSAEYAALAAALAIMVGFVLVAGAIFRLGWIADLLSIPVTIGFLAGISAHIFISQLPGVLGLPSPDGPMLQRVAILARHVNEANPITLVIGLGVLAVIAVSERINARIPGALIGLILATAAVVLVGLESRGVTVLGDVFGALPTLAIPDIPVGRLARLVPLSLIIATVVMVQTAATTRSFPSDPNEPTGCRSRLCRGRSRQHPVGPHRRISSECQPAAHRYRVRDWRTITARRPRRGGHRSRIVGIRRHASAPCSPCGARRRPAVRRA